MRRFSFSSLRFRLLIIVLLAIVPAFGLILYDASEQRKLAINMAYEEAMRLARLVDNLHENIIKDAQVLLATIAQLPEIRQGSLAQCNTLMTDLVKTFSFYANLGIVDSKGYTFCNAVDPKSRAYAGDRPRFQRAIKKKKFSIGEYVIGRITDRPVLVCGYPVFDSVGQV